MDLIHLFTLLSRTENIDRAKAACNRIVSVDMRLNEAMCIKTRCQSCLYFIIPKEGNFPPKFALDLNDEKLKNNDRAGEEILKWV